MQSGFVPLRDVIHLNKRGQPTADVFPRLSVRISELTLIAQRQVEPPEADGDEPAQEHHIEKVKRRIRSVTTGHLVEGTISLYQAVDLMTFLESSDPAFLPITDATVRWLSDRRLKGRFDFLLLNRAHAVAYSEAS